MTRTQGPLVSIVTTSYNYGRFIGRTIRSVLEQTYDHWELLIIDDGSTDDSVEVIQSFHDERIRFLGSGSSRGACVVYNEAYPHCRGQYVCSLDSDDYFVADKLEKMMRFLEDNPAIDVLGTQVLQVDGEGNAASDAGELHGWFNSNFDLNDPKNWLFQNHLCHSSVMIRKVAHDQVGPLDNALKLTPDYDFWLRGLGLGLRFAVLPEPLTCYRIHGNNVSKKGDPDRLFLEYAYLLHARLIPWLTKLDRHELLQGATYDLFNSLYLRASAGARQRALASLLGGGAGFARFQEGRSGDAALSETAIRLLDSLLLEFAQTFKQLKSWIDELEKSRSWAREQAANWEQTAKERERMVVEKQVWIDQLEKGRVWLEQDRDNWQYSAQEREKVIQEQKAWIDQLEQERDKVIQEQKAWINQLEQEREKVVQQLEQERKDWIDQVEKGRAWMDQLEKGRIWLEQDRSNWRHSAQEREKVIQQQKAWIEELTAANEWLVSDRARWEQATKRGEKLIEEQKAWIAELTDAKEWFLQQLHALQRESDGPRAASAIDREEAARRLVESMIV
jgi:glycosyltransferase involved in cell wall biosynthesis